MSVVFFRDKGVAGEAEEGHRELGIRRRNLGVGAGSADGGGAGGGTEVVEMELEAEVGVEVEVGAGLLTSEESSEASLADGKPRCFAQSRIGMRGSGNVRCLPNVFSIGVSKCGEFFC